MGRRSTVLLLVLSAAASQAEETLKGVLVTPPVATVVVGKKGAFVGVDTRKTIERFDAAAHLKLVTAFNAKLGGKALPADTAQGILTKEGVTAPTLDNPGVLERVAKAANVEWVVTFTLSRTNLLTARLFDATGKPAGEPTLVNEVATVTEAQAQTVAALVAPKLLALEKARVDAIAEAKRKAAAELPPPPPPPEELVDSDLEQLKVKQSGGPSWQPERNRVRALVAVGPGAALRGLELAGDAVATLADLENGAVVGLGVTAQVLPLELFDATAGRAWSQLSLEVHYRHAFVQAKGVSGGLEGETCSMNDDDLQLRAGWRYRLGDGYLPTIGIAGGWSQEQTKFQCSLPLVSTTWRGIDAQLRVRQPLFRDFVTLELIGGPRFLLPGPLAESRGVSLSAEAWLEVKPVSVLFARAGARFSRLQAGNASLSAIDTRTFVALELGAFF
jgi:hypothetical protein